MMKETKDKLNAYITKYMSLWDFYGVIQVIKKGKVLFQNAYGYANLEFELRNNMNSCFSIASMSKQFTAFGIMILYDKKMLDIDNPAKLYLPSNIQIDESITIHHLLSHTSGLYNYYNFEDDFLAGYNRLDYLQNVFFEKYVNKQPQLTPGITYNYNNSNYNLLAWIIENVSGEKYADFIRNNIFLPLGMVNSDIDDGCKIIKNRSSNYLMDFDSYIKIPYYNEKFSIGAGAIVSNCEDLFKWYTCLKDRKIISGETHDRFFTENKNNYCYGLEHHYVCNNSCYSHGGDHLGISTYMQNFFDEDICIIILSNNESINQYKLGNAISDILHDIEVPTPAKFDEASLNKSFLKEYCGTYLKDKIKIEFINEKLYFTRFCGNLHIEIYPVGEGEFARRYFDQINPYRIIRNDNNQLVFLGYAKYN